MTEAELMTELQKLFDLTCWLGSVAVINALLAHYRPSG